jgi:acyl-CoA thioester hydrolase
MPSEIVTKFRVRYAETDRMGYAYYGNYAAWFEVGRVELLRKSGMSYREMEDHGIILPVRDLHVRYHKPAKYDEVVELHTTLKNLRGPRIVFDYLLTNEMGEKLCTAEITLVFVDVESGKPVHAPKEVEEAFSD